MEKENRFSKKFKGSIRKIGLEFETNILELAVANSPDNFELLFSLGNAYTKSGRYEDGLKVDQKLCSLAPENSIVHYNLACSLSLLGKIDESLVALKKALELGYSEFNFMRIDPDMDNARKDGRFEKILLEFEKHK